MSDTSKFPVQLKAPSWVDDFKAFIMRGNVVDLAVGVVIGAAFTGIVSSLVKDVINPIIGLITGGVDFSNHFIILKGTPALTLADAQKAGDVTLNYGVFINAVINFVIVAAAIFWMVRMVQKIYKKPTPPAAAPAPTPTETLLTEIRDLLKDKGTV
ncbi:MULTISPECIES: large conductance mechanosensitive channel protein MscL [Acidocella]|uniref:large conductance mechanosensitive channel protein MscL n=2 Tax=Acidocellaceae TaxID=3385905 RepID=UPI00028D3FE7|nr:MULTISPECIES: large conductance mechanosensitive channel protein MscL [Acidocella]EKM98957.1 large conductance mechanosensitive channel protein [Acidocella sp. MX-AZ02]